MASSQTSSLNLKKKDSIVDGRLFVRLYILNRIKSEHEDATAMELVVSHIKQSGLYYLGKQLSDLYEEKLVEEFYQTASVRLHSAEKRGDIASISTQVRGVEICINRHMLKDIFRLPSYGLTMEDLESFGSEELMNMFRCVFIGSSSDKKDDVSHNDGRTSQLVSDCS
ncbi:hypothetical protein OROMI_017098 [Orobanche minor]